MKFSYVTLATTALSMFSSLRICDAFMKNGRLNLMRSPVNRDNFNMQHLDVVEGINQITQAVSTGMSSTPYISASLFLSDEEILGYSPMSLYFTLGLYVLTLPGLYSLVTRSVKASPTLRTYDIPGPANPTAKPLRQTAAEVMAYFKALNYEVSAAENTITFKGVLGQSKAQAAFLTFCTFMGLGSFALVLSILLPDLGAKAYALTLLSPYAGIYYWNNAQRVDEVTVKMETSDDEQITSIFARGGKEDLERFSRTLGFAERGKVYVKGLFEGDSAPPAQVGAGNSSGGISSGNTDTLVSVPVVSPQSQSEPGKD